MEEWQTRVNAISAVDWSVYPIILPDNHLLREGFPTDSTNYNLR